MIKGLAIIFSCLLTGEIIVTLLDLPFPGSIIGMIMLTILLELKVIKLDDVKGVSNTLIGNMSLLFIPPGVALMLYFNLLKNEFIAIATSTVISTFLVMALTGFIQQKLGGDDDSSSEQ